VPVLPAIVSHCQTPPTRLTARSCGRLGCTLAAGGCGRGGGAGLGEPTARATFVLPNCTADEAAASSNVNGTACIRVTCVVGGCFLQFSRLRTPRTGHSSRPRMPDALRAAPCGPGARADRSRRYGRGRTPGNESRTQFGADGDRHVARARSEPNARSLADLFGAAGPARNCAGRTGARLPRRPPDGGVSRLGRADRGVRRYRDARRGATALGQLYRRGLRSSGRRAPQLRRAPSLVARRRPSPACRRSATRTP
jgi:hypothetical protein